MSLFRRQQTATLEPPPVSAGTSLCDARGCVNYTAVQCGYRDRRGRACTATFCPSHHVKIADSVFCRRHANTVTALGERGKDPNALPDLEDRGPSLVRWIANDLDAAIRSVLSKAARPGETVVAEDGVALAHDASRRGRWERCWKLVESTGEVIKVTIHVTARPHSAVQ